MNCFGAESIIREEKRREVSESLEDASRKRDERLTVLVRKERNSTLHDQRRIRRTRERPPKRILFRLDPGLFFFRPD